MKIGNMMVNQSVIKTDIGKPISKENESSVPWSPAVQVEAGKKGEPFTEEAFTDRRDFAKCCNVLCVL